MLSTAPSQPSGTSAVAANTSPTPKAAMTSSAASEHQASRLSQLLRHWVKALNARSG